MNKIIFALFILIPAVSFGQVDFIEKLTPTDGPDIHYYKFYDGIQMIEFDYLSSYHRKVNFLEQARPRALTWEMELGPPHPNVYLFRNKNDEIVQQYGERETDLRLLSVKESIEIAISHNSLNAQLGSTVGFSRISTRYFPYYLIGEASLGLIDSTGNVVLPQAYNTVWEQDFLFITRKGDTNQLRDLQLNVLFSSNELQLQPSYSNKGYVDVIEADKKGLMDSTGKIIIPCKYDFLISRFNEFGLAKVRREGPTGYVNKKGKEVIACKYQSAGDFSEGLLNARYKDKWGYINTSGKTIVRHKYDLGTPFVDGLARVAKKQGADEWLYGFIDKKGKEVIPLSYSNAKDFNNGIAEVKIDGRWTTIDKKGERLK